MVSSVRLRWIWCVVGLVGCGSRPPEQTQPARGLLQFRVRHNLADRSCVGRNDCYLEVEDETAPRDWVAEVARYTTMPVLHWDRSIPWLAFVDAPPAGVDRVVFHDALLDEPLRRWLDAFAEDFRARPGGYLAVSLLHGSRNRAHPLRLDAEREVELSGDCPALEPDTVFEVVLPDGGAVRSIPLRAAYRNFLLYLHAKLRPQRFALAVEVNFFRSFCPDRWAGLVRLYHALYDDVRAAVGGGVKLFATLAYSLLLGHDVDSCNGLAWSGCGQPPAPAPRLDPARCYPVDRTAVDDLAAGGRLDVLGLSFYPDGLLMAVPGAEDAVVRAYPTDQDGSGDCLVQAALPTWIDPMTQLDQLGWTGPVALAETSARACPSQAWQSNGTNAFVLRAPGSEGNQAFWLEHLLAVAKERRFDFVVWSFLRDYEPLGPWLVREGVLDPYTFSVFNTWPCSGLLRGDGTPRALIADTWGALR